jgi:hypothetical protein
MTSVNRHLVAVTVDLEQLIENLRGYGYTIVPRDMKPLARDERKLITDLMHLAEDSAFTMEEAWGQFVSTGEQIVLNRVHKDKKESTNV